MEACLAVLEISFESIARVSSLGLLVTLSSVEVELVIEEALKVLSSPDWRYFLLSGMVKRCQRVAKAGTSARPIWSRQIASSWLYSPAFNALLKQPRRMSVTMEPARVPYSHMPLVAPL